LEKQIFLPANEEKFEKTECKKEQKPCLAEFFAKQSLQMLEGKA